MTEDSGCGIAVADEKKFDASSMANEIIDNGNFGAYKEAIDGGVDINYEELRQMMLTLCAKKLVEIGSVVDNASRRYSNALAEIQSTELCGEYSRPMCTAMIWRVCAELKGLVITNCQNGKIEVAGNARDSANQREKTQK